MAQVTLTLIDGPNGVLLKVHSDEPLPGMDEGGTPAQELGLIALATLQLEFKGITGKDLTPIDVH